MISKELNSQFKKGRKIATIPNLKKVIYQAMLVMNIILFGFSVLYQLFPDSNLNWNIYGVLILLIFLGNLIMITLSTGRNMFEYFYITLFMFSMICIPILNTVTSMIPTNKMSTNIISPILMLLLLLAGALVSFIAYKKEKGGEDVTKKYDKESVAGRIRKHFKLAIIFMLSILLIFGVYISYAIITGANIGDILQWFVPEYSLFYGYLFMATSVMIIKLGWRKKRRLKNRLIASIGILLFIVCTLPILSMPRLIKEADKSFTAAFGDINTQKSNELKKGLFRITRFSIPEYFYGTKSKDYNIKENILFYEGIKGVDKGLKLSFDVYTPTTDGKKLPGNQSVLIRIHGGAWVMGDKGTGNFPEVNKYFAAQGYVVFDIQYGLYNGKNYVDYSKEPIGVYGNYSIDDMFNHIGKFTKYLAQHSKEYNANLSSVFISGGSAGGQLTNAVGLGIASGKYNNIFDNRIKIKGIIPFYPANGVACYLGLKGTQDLVEPANLVSQSSPPCLIYQGDHDSLATPDLALKFLDAYLKNNNAKCALLNMPYATHGSDIYFSGNYNQVFMYYMERFMYRYQ